ncbi:helix-turn-helix transcriptional regulator [Gordonia sihwensis]|uniref:helix-turn-helix transcriptional regulator n=1 Tax=Gordonia sihwensis TaxID=173559 RepID=UPI000698DE50|nr:helix-turn-helix transcriptional regulator [Gordonia sihwensis]
MALRDFDAEAGNVLVLTTLRGRTRTGWGAPRGPNSGPGRRSSRTAAAPTSGSPPTTTICNSISRCRTAAHFIDAHARDLPTVAEIAAAAGVSVRSLSGGFARYLGTSVRSYLVEQRLQGVYRELRSGVESVTATAHAWGYVNLGVFAASYRRRFGENPSQTLARARS